MNIDQSTKYRDMDAQHREVSVSTPSTGQGPEQGGGGGGGLLTVSSTAEHEPVLGQGFSSIDNLNLNLKPPGSPMPGTYRFRGYPGRRRSKTSFMYAMLLQWFVILLLIGGMYGVLFSYTTAEVLSHKDKRIFNALITGLAIGLALITISFLNGLVIELRWWMLSRRYRSRRKVESILHAHSLRKAVMLAFTSKRVSVHFFAVGWILLLLTSQVGLASINLCFVLQTNEEYALLVPGNVSIPDLANINTNTVTPTQKTIAAQQYTANQFGTIALAFGYSYGNFEIPPVGRLYNMDEPLVFCDEDASTCRYQFHETNTESQQPNRRFPVESATDRIVVTTAECRSYPVIQGGNGTEGNITVDMRDGDGSTKVVALPVTAGPDQTTFITDTFAVPSSCGEGCVGVQAFEAVSNGQAWYYDCTCRVGQVSNTKLPQHELGTNLTIMAAQAVALQGYTSSLSGAGVGANGTVGSVGTGLLRIQAQIYPSESWWGQPLNGSTQNMGFLLARFSANVVAMAAESNDPTVVWGMAPVIGIRVHMEHWPVVHAILVLTAVLLLVLGFGAAYLGNRVVVPPPGPVAEAQVLRAMMPSDRGGRLRKGDSGRRGGVHEGRKTVWIYRDELVGGGVHDLYMEETEVAVTMHCETLLGWFKRWRKGEKSEKRASQEAEGP